MAGKTISSLSVALFANVAPFAGGLNVGKKAVSGFVSSVGSAGSTLLKFTSIAGLVGGALGAIGSLRDGIQLAGTLDKNTAALTTMLGSADAAKRTVQDLTSFASKTPFEIPDVLETGKRLLSLGEPAGQLKTDLKAIGDVAAGSGAPLTELGTLYGKAMTTGVVNGRVLNGMIAQGIPITSELAKVMNQPQSAIAGLAKSGQISFGALRQAMLNMSGPGGQFNDQMARQAATLPGIWKRASESVNLAVAHVVQSIEGGFNLGMIGDRVVGFVDAAGNGLARLTAIAAPYIASFAGTVYRGFVGLWDLVSPPLTMIGRGVGIVFAGAVSIVTTAAPAIYAAVAGAFSAVYNFVAPIFGAIYSVIASNWQGILEVGVTYGLALFNFVQGAWSALTGIASMAWSGIVAVWSWGANAIFGSTSDSVGGSTTVLQGLVNTWKFVMDGISTGVNIAGFALTHWRDTIELVMDSAALDVITFANQTQYLFTDVIPAVISWFAGNWRDVFADEYNFTNTLFANLGKNIFNVMKNLPGLIKGSVSFGDLWTPLTTGFQSALKQLPNIPERQMGALESSMDQQVKDLQVKYGNGLGNYLATQSTKATDATKAITAGIGSVISQAKVPTPIVGKPAVPKPDPIAFNAVVNPQNMTLGITPEMKHAKAVMSGSAESQAMRYAAPLLMKSPLAMATPAQQPLANPVAAATQQNDDDEEGDGTPSAAAGPQLASSTTPVASVRAAPQGGSKQSGGAIDTSALLEQLKQIVYWQVRIEQDLRNNSNPVASLTG